MCDWRLFTWHLQCSVTHHGNWLRNRVHLTANSTKTRSHHNCLIKTQSALQHWINFLESYWCWTGSIQTTAEDVLVSGSWYGVALWIMFMHYALYRLTYLLACHWLLSNISNKLNSEVFARNLHYLQSITTSSLTQQRYWLNSLA